MRKKHSRVKRPSCWVVINMMVVTTNSVEAQQFPDRMFPVIELTDEMRDQIDLKDGSVEDWLQVLGEPTLTPLDFYSFVPTMDSYNPSSYDFRIWLAWHDSKDHLFVAIEFVDDFHVSNYDRYKPGSDPEGDSSVQLYVDGDKSGGRFSPNEMQQAQVYTAFARTYNNDSNVTLVTVSPIADWVHKLPYADGGGNIVDSQPVLSVVEFYVTPFDHLIWDNPGESIISNLTINETIGFALMVSDIDTGPIRINAPTEFDSIHALFGPEASFGLPGVDVFWESDLWARGILLGSDNPTGDTAVESVSWARIKASLPE